MAGIQIRNDTITPVLRRAVRYQPHAFFFMYPFPLSLTANEKSKIVLEMKPGFWKFVPWYLSLFFISGVANVGPCIYVVFSYAFNLQINSAVDIQILHVIISLGLGIFGISEVAAMITIFKFPEFIHGFNKFVHLESKSFQKKKSLFSYQLQN